MVLNDRASAGRWYFPEGFIRQESIFLAGRNSLERLGVDE